MRAFVREWFDYSERRMADALKELPSVTLVGRTTHDPYPGLPDGIPLKVTVQIVAEEGRVEIDLRDNPDNYAGGLNESRACATNNVITGVFNSIDPDIPHNAGSFRCIRVHLREGCIAGIPRFPHSCSMATTNVADRLVCMTQAAFADIGEGFGLAEGAFGIGISFAVVSGRDHRLDGAPYVNQIFLGGSGRARLAGGRRLADLHPPRLRGADVPRQHRGGRAEVPVPRLREAADPRLGGCGAPSRRPGNERRLRARRTCP